MLHTLADLRDLAKRVPRITNADGQTAMDHRSPEWTAYQAALRHNGKLHKARKAREAVARAASEVIAAGESYVRGLRKSTV